MLCASDKAIIHSGLTPMLADIDSKTQTIDLVASACTRSIA